MKKLLFALALACSLQVAYAQKPDADMQKGVDKALEASKDAKKGAKPATWMNLGKAYWAAYTNPTTSMSTGIDKATFALMNKEKPASVTNVTIQGANFEKQELSHVNVYFNEAGVLAIVEVTHPSVPGDLLGEAAAAYVKAFELGAKDKDVDPKLQEVVNGYYNDAFTAYQLGDMAKASDLFKGAADWSAVAPCSVRNDDAAYNCAFTALAVKNYDRAMEYYNKCLERGFTSEGNIYAALSECSLAKADTLAAKNYLATGLTQFPDNASILTSLINLYLTTNEDPKKIVELLDEAKKAMPDNASLYYVEGNILAGGLLRHGQHRPQERRGHCGPDECPGCSRLQEVRRTQRQTHGGVHWCPDSLRAVLQRFHQSGRKGRLRRFPQAPELPAPWRGSQVQGSLREMGSRSERRPVIVRK